MKLYRILLPAICILSFNPSVSIATPASNEVVWKVKTDQKLIALTFDDGPNPVYTPQILNLLTQYQAKGTFFVIGKRVQLYPAIVIREVNDGHEIANHTYDHHYLKNYPAERLVDEIRQTQEIIFDITEQRPIVFRPPGGFYSDALLQSMKEDKLTVVMWSWYQDTKDWRRPGVDKIVNQVLNNVHNGDIVLFHDKQGDCSQTVASLKYILPELKKQGYQFVTVSELITKSQK
ncbi:polysaccharide deacetylase family protein [Paenibacillus frigoriresistens]|uniref:polysaccharide deacetylase family protein n=1 Tax=Paenibacillus alginolyticus TaxID=59839 RepID=UPI0015673640|nr:polysaccharide deacetylase family protein [Paenibacillus frigoriresistens]NRF93074.1 polysaccharide deacetylase family protein [Paenibacillus frigoriresistens]